MHKPYLNSDCIWQVVYLELVPLETAEINASRLPPEFHLSFIENYSDSAAITALNEVDSISCGGISISPGDKFVGDEDGVVVISQRDITFVIGKLKEISAKENEIQQKIDAGWTLPEWIEKELNAKGISYIDE